MMTKPLEFFAALVQQDDSIPLFEAALSIAQAAEPLLDLNVPQLAIDLLAAKLQRRLPSDASHIQKLRMLNHYFYHELGFAGNINNYYDPDNSYLQQGDSSDLPLATYLQEARPRDILVRMLRNLKALFSEHAQWQNLLAVQERLLILLPDEITERRDRGLAYSNLQCPQAALQDFEAYLAERPHAADADAVRSRLPELREASRRFN